MPELLRDERIVKRTEDGKILFMHIQEQKYEEITRQNMIKEWQEELVEKQSWLDRYDEALRLTKEQAELELSKMKKQITKDIEFIKQGIEIWSNVRE
jgi:hypothetical protein